MVTGDPSLAQALWSFAHGMLILEMDERYPPGSDLDLTWQAGADAFEWVGQWGQGDSGGPGPGRDGGRPGGGPILMSMHAAVVRSFDHPPRYESFDTPVPEGPDEVLVDVLAVGLHPRVRTDAAGRHYTSTGTLPLIPGIDGVGRLPDGRRIYFVVPDGTWGSMADQAVVDLRRTVTLPEDVDVPKVAASMNPAMSAWVALRRRVPLEEGQSVLVLGATGNAGGMAVQIAKRLGASRVVGAGRNQERLAELAAEGADEVVALGGDPEETADRLGCGGRLRWTSSSTTCGGSRRLPP